jgi:deoxyribose-phosphate aldolase
MKLTKHDIARMIDFSVVRPDVTEKELAEFITNVKKYHFIGAHAMPCYIPHLREALKDYPDVLIGGVIGFPFGTSKTEIKVAETKAAIKDGCHEIDMVMNIGKLLSGDYAYVEHDIHAVVKAAQTMPVKVIFEIHFLTLDQIRKACEISVKAGAKFVKTSTGNAPSGATVEAIRIMKETVKDNAQVKASGGIRTVMQFVELYQAGARRFGISAASTLKIFKELETYPDETVQF